MSKRKVSLGRGLDALLDGAKLVADVEVRDASPSFQTNEKSASAINRVLRELPIEYIVRGKYQPRKEIDGVALEELANSIRKHGIMQPVVVRPVEEKKYELIAGERRWRACQLAGLSSIPVVIKEVSDEATMAMALIENIQREDLTPMEQGVALHQLKERFQLTQKELADAVGKSRVSVTNLLRLMNLCTEVKRMLEHGDLEMGHARALLSLEENVQWKAAKWVVARGLSVRQTEQLVRRIQKEGHMDVKVEKVRVDANVRRLEEDLSAKVGVTVEVKQESKGRGKVIFRYRSLDELDGILTHIV